MAKKQFDYVAATWNRYDEGKLRRVLRKLARAAVEMAVGPHKPTMDAIARELIPGKAKAK